MRRMRRQQLEFSKLFATYLLMRYAAGGSTTQGLASHVLPRAELML
jgi:hypothetical protein